MPLSYFAIKLSDNIATTPEGYLLAKDAILARSGSQRYALSELPEDAVRDLDAKAGNDGMVDVFRPEEEVFSAKSIASLEGKPVTHDHPSNGRFVAPENIRELQMGHVQNVRRGAEPLPSGEWPLIGDLVITHEPLISDVKNGLRELSAGYDYRLVKQDGRLTQTDIIHNHVAVVPHARAGAAVRIQDAAPSSQEVASKADERKEKPKMSNIFRHLLGLGLKAYATDADPEKLAEAAEAIKEHADDKRADDKKCDDKQKDEAPLPVAKKPELKAVPGADAADRARLHKLLDRLMDEEEPEVKPALVAAKPSPEEAREMADNKRLHSSLDRFMKRSDAMAAEDKKALDADIRELRDLFDEYLSEEEAEPEHADDIEHDLEAGEETLLEAEHLPAGKDGFDSRVGDNFIEPIAAESRKARDAAEAAFLRQIRPAIARSGDTAAIKQFNVRLRALTGKSRVSAGDGYQRFASAAAAPREEVKAAAPNRDALYAKLHGRTDYGSALSDVMKQPA